MPLNKVGNFFQENYVEKFLSIFFIYLFFLFLNYFINFISLLVLILGNTDQIFAINVNNGELYLRRPLDYERENNYQLTIEATNLLGMNASTKIFINIIDINDNAPYWNQTVFYGQVFESAPVNTFVQTDNGTPLVIKAFDKDYYSNLIYSIVDDLAKQYFSIEPRTGALSLLKLFDCDQYKQFQFNVMVTDNGMPKMKAQNDATVIIKCLPVNDCQPVFLMDRFYAVLLLPTYKDVIVAKVTATDCDKDAEEELRYAFGHNNNDNSNSSNDQLISKFSINATTGQIMIANVDIKPDIYKLMITVTDGTFTGNATVIIEAKPIPISTLRFRQSRYQASIEENSSNIKIITMPAIEGNKLHENLIFSILNPTNLFKIARTSGAILYRGIPVDRETTPKYVFISILPF